VEKGSWWEGFQQKVGFTLQMLGRLKVSIRGRRIVFEPWESQKTRIRKYSERIV
jgi:hypothetical protein